MVLGRDDWRENRGSLGTSKGRDEKFYQRRGIIRRTDCLRCCRRVQVVRECEAGRPIQVGEGDPLLIHFLSTERFGSFMEALLSSQPNHVSCTRES